MMKTSKPYSSKSTTATSTATATNTSTDAPDDHDDDDVKVGVSSSIASDAPPRREWRSSMDEYNRKVAGENSSASATAPSSSVPSDAPPRREWRSSMDEYNRKVAGEHTSSAAAPSSLAQPDAPTRERGYGLTYIQGKFSSSPDQEVSRPGAFHGGVEVGSSDAPRRERGLNKEEFRRQRPGQTTSATAPSSLAPPDVPTRERNSGLDEFQGKFSSSPTEDQEPEARESNISAVPSPSLTQDQHYSQPGAFRLGPDNTSEWTLSGTGDAEGVTDLSPVPEIHHSRENTQGQYLAEANLVVEPDLVFGEPLEEPKGIWSQRKVQGLILFLCLLLVGVGVGVGVGVQGGTTLAFVGSTPAPSMSESPTPAPSISESPTPAPSTPEPPNFDCSNTTVGCLFTGTQSLGIQDPASFLVANCTDTNFEIPTRENCQCEINIPTSPFGNPEHCESCSFVDSGDGEWRLEYDCSNLLSGDCVGRDFSNNCISRVRFNTTSELREAVDAYLVNNSTGTAVARTYGSPIGSWDVSKIQDFSYLFSADESAFSEHFNPAGAYFNEDISDWDVSSAITMTSMFAGARSFDQSLADWDVSSVTDMSFMFSRAISFDQPLADWNVSSVTDMSNTFYSATSFNRPLGDWDVSSLRDVSFMFSYATSFNQSFADWNVLTETDVSGMFTEAEFVVIVQVQHDNFPAETRWTLRDSTGTSISSQPYGSLTPPGGTVTMTSSVALGSYTFEMTTSFGGGICCFNGPGSFSIAVNGDTVVSNNGQFSGSVQETFEVKAPNPSRFMGFESTGDLRAAVDSYLASNSTNTLVARNYGWPIGIWNVSKIQDFSYLFSASEFIDGARFNSAASNFNEDISRWDTSSATTMTSMYNQAFSFNQPIGNWDVSSVADMSRMFQSASSFNQPLAEWNVSNVTTMRNMFALQASFNQPLADWNVSSVTTMRNMFDSARSFNQPLADWNVSSVTSMDFMFAFATSFNQPLADWDVSSVTGMYGMFRFAYSFNQALADWNVSTATDLTDIFTDTECPVAEGEKSCFYFENTAAPSSSPSASPSPIAAPSAVPSAGPSSSASPSAFTVEVQVQVHYDDYPRETGWTLRDSTGTVISSQPTGSFTTQNSTVTNTTSVALGMYTFEMTDTAGDGICCGFGSGSFSIAVHGETVISNNGQFGNIAQETFEVRASTPSRFLVFETTEELREAVDLYLVDNSTNTLVARNYGWPIGVWDVSKIQDFSYLFSADESVVLERFNPAAATFNEDISRWEVSSATSMIFMFDGAASFDKPLGDWNVSSVTNMRSMFYKAASFNQSLADWNVSRVANMPTMFYEASSFDQPLAGWNVSSVKNMRFMFAYSTSFNQPLADWNLLSVTDVGGMFNRATSFNQPLADWNVSSVTDMSFMFAYATSFNQPIGNWDVSSETDLTNIFGNSGCPGAEGEEESCFYVI